MWSRLQHLCRNASLRSVSFLSSCLSSEKPKLLDKHQLLDLPIILPGGGDVRRKSKSENISGAGVWGVFLKPVDCHRRHWLPCVWFARRPGGQREKTQGNAGLAGSFAVGRERKATLPRPGHASAIHCIHADYENK